MQNFLKFLTYVHILIALKHIKDEILLKNLYEMAKMQFNNLLSDGKVTNQQAATLYSLFKQETMGDADEFEKNKQKTESDKYQVWD